MTRRNIPGSWLASDRALPSRFVRPVLRFTQVEAAGGIVLLAAAVAALLWANSPVGETYETFWETRISLDLEVLSIEKSLREVVNDGLMTLFFFVVGLEIKRELTEGELRDPRAALLPALAAGGGMVVPAAIYLLVNAGQETARGWGIPMATDIAFSLGVVALLGATVPAGAKLFLLAVAVADDIGVIAVIALFYTEDLSFGWLATALGLLAAVAIAQGLGVRSMSFYLPVGVVCWLAFLESGVHATLAGVALGLLTPNQALYRDEEYMDRARQLIGEMTTNRDHAEERSDADALALAGMSRESVSPLHRLEGALHPWSSFAIVPVFALANAGVAFGRIDTAAALTSPVAVGVVLGLVVGKTLGISMATGVGVRLGWGKLPERVTMRHVLGVAMLGGIGFTVSLFVAGLAFSDPGPSASAKVGIFLGSVVAGLAGFALLRWWARPRPPVTPG